MFGDILSDLAAMLTGSIGEGCYPPPLTTRKKDCTRARSWFGTILLTVTTNPLAMIMSLAMMFQYSFEELKAGQMIINPVASVIKKDFVHKMSTCKGERRLAQRVNCKDPR